MKYPASLLTPFLATLSQDVPLGSRRHPRVSILSTLLSACASIACALLKSLASLFVTPFLYFQSVADCKKPGGGGGTSCPNPSRKIGPTWPPLTTFKINTCKSVTK